ncbi:hypothetical protein NQ315_000639 [Exocentrus adspersus]|uniref:DDE Tnp4 domain-containing protein n=1 Tax=Exocentrus adspersus TaxID=1586481 RepID=A0AAV8VNL4_9CUCU|nr:hypothetical protein NQ315_000639 [Exocentrus adspersus]
MMYFTFKTNSTILPDSQKWRRRRGLQKQERFLFYQYTTRWPGSAHDMTIFNNSRIRARFEMGEFRDSWLYSQTILNPLRPEENRYNEAHIRTRNIIERTFGIWKRQFLALAYDLRCKLNTSLIIIVATAVLHNIARAMNENIPPENIDMEELNYLI